MRIGIACNIQGQSTVPAEGPDDLEEEFDKPETVETIAAALGELGHQVTVLGDGPPLLRCLLDDPPDFVFNFAEGTGISRSREARVPAVLEMLGIPYSGSDPLTLAVTLDKDCAKRLVQSAGLKTPKWLLVSAERAVRIAEQGGLESARHTGESDPGELSDRVGAAGMGFPLIVKPAYEGSSKGIHSKSLVESPPELLGAVSELQQNYRQPMLIEEFIGGDEVTVGVLGNSPPQVLGLMRVLPAEPNDRFIYSLDRKRDWRRLICYEAPAQLPAAVTSRLEEAALTAHQALGCRDVSRVDFRLHGDEPYFLEVNPLPGLHPDNSDLVMIARGYGMSHAELVRAIFRSACLRQCLAYDERNRQAARV